MTASVRPPSFLPAEEGADASARPLPSDVPDDFDVADAADLDVVSPLLTDVAPVQLDFDILRAEPRLDRALSVLHPDLSRNQWKKRIEEGCVQLNGVLTYKPRQNLFPGDRLHCVLPVPALHSIAPEDIPLDILYEDDDLIVLDKPAGLVVHPAPGHTEGTLVNALLHHCGNSLPGAGSAGIDRPGIVHRLDRYTSGLFVAAKNEKSLLSLKAQFAAHTVFKEYLALVWGVPSPSCGAYRGPIARHPSDRKRMAVVPSGRPALTFYTTLAAGSAVSLQRIRIRTGRTHQIRVHYATDGHAVAGDATYGPSAATRLSALHLPPTLLPRQMLHACHLRFLHPATSAPLDFHLPPPADFLAAAERLLSSEDEDASPGSQAPAHTDASGFPMCGKNFPHHGKNFPHCGNIFPITGKTAEIFSNHWKNRETFCAWLDEQPPAGPADGSRNEDGTPAPSPFPEVRR